MLPLIDSPSLSAPTRGCLNIAVFLFSLFLLERSADVFVESTEVVAKRLGIPTILVGLLTAGAEWEELAVVVSSLAQHHPALALSNIYGSSIANVLGSFSIGLLFSPAPLIGTEEKSARIYVVLLLILSCLITALGFGLGNSLKRNTSRAVIGGSLIAIFAFYVSGIAYGIYKGVVTAPEGSDSDSDSESGSDTSSESSQASLVSEGTPLLVESARQTPNETGHNPILQSKQQIMRRRKRIKLWKHLGLFLLSSILLSVSGYLLSSTTASLAELAHLSQSSLGLTLLSFSTTLPEKLVAFKSGRKSQTGVLVANTVGSNVFLGSLVLGVVWLTQGRVELGQGASDGRWDAMVVLFSSVVLASIVWFGAFKRSIGVCMLAGYIVYLVSVLLR